VKITDEMRKAACASMGTKQCAPICLCYSHLENPCPAYRAVWTEQALRAELKRRSDGPLREFSEEISS